MLEWKGDVEMFNDVEPHEELPTGQLGARLFLVRQASLVDMIGRFLMIREISSFLSDTMYGKLFLGFCVVALVNPFKIKLLKGSGLDSLIENAQIDDETNCLYVDKKSYHEYCRAHDLNPDVIDWFEEHGFAESSHGFIFFKNKFKHGKVFNFT
ncbi:hypothetical protein [Prosthecochloris aestuarii]|nr:hypothetical protein [Prosthecochloris aestuarii]